jgi:hypothetical protein
VRFDEAGKASAGHVAGVDGAGSVADDHAAGAEWGVEEGCPGDIGWHWLTSGA